MRTRTWRFVSMGAAVFFVIQLIAEVLIPMGGTLGNAAGILRPLDGDVRLEASRRNVEQKNGEMRILELKKSLRFLDQAIRRNPLNYRTQYERARLLLRLESAGEDTSDAANSAMRRVIILRWKRPEIGLAGMRFGLSRWPLLTAEDQETYRQLFGNLVNVSKGAVSGEILEAWGRYSRDMTMLESGLVRKPEFYRIAAQALAKFQIHPEARLRFQARYEAWSVNHFRSLLQKRIREGRDPYDTWSSISENLNEAVHGYYRLAPREIFDRLGYTRLMDRLQLNMVMKLTGSMEWSRRISSLRKIQKVVEEMLARPAAPSTLRQLRRRLERTRFFNLHDLKTLELRMRLLLATGELTSAALLGASEVEGRYYVPAQEADAVRRIFLLYAATLKRMDQLEEAVKVIHIARERTGRHLSLDWMAFRLRNPGRADPQSPEWKALPDEIRNSYQIMLQDERIVRARVFPPPQAEMVLEVTKEGEAMLLDSRLVQVWADGLILAERYAKALKPGSRWHINLPENKEKIPVTVEVRVR